MLVYLPQSVPPYSLRPTLNMKHIVLPWLNCSASLWDLLASTTKVCPTSLTFYVGAQIQVMYMLVQQAFFPLSHIYNPSDDF